MTEYNFTWTDADLAKLSPGVGLVVVFKNADGTIAPQLRVLAMAWRGHVFVLSGSDGRRFQSALLEQCDPASIVTAAELAAIARGAAGSAA